LGVGFRFVEEKYEKRENLVKRCDEEI